MQHTEQVHGRTGVYKGVRAWEHSRSQAGAITTGVAATDYCYQVDDSQYDGYRRAWICNICDSSYAKKKQLEQHLTSGVHEEARYECDGCYRKYASLGSLSQHLAATGHSSKEARLIHVMVQDAQQPMLMLTNGNAQRFFEATLYFDGSAQPNPGAGGAGIYLHDDRGACLHHGGFAVSTIGHYGNVTSNQAEYAALKRGMEIAIEEGVKRLRVRGDSELVINQLNGEYRCSSDRLKWYHDSIQRLEREFHNVEYEHIPRDQNRIADALADKYCAWV